MIYVNRFNNDINIISKYNDKTDIKVNLNNTGNNNIFNFAGIYLIPNSNDIISKDLLAGINIESIGSDWIGPHRVFAIKNINGDMPFSKNFTGGNHAYDGAHKGTVTGRTSIVQLYIDGIKCDNISRYGNYADIYWTNYVQATNTKKEDGLGREVLKESFHIHFSGDKYEIDAKINFLEDLIWETYYGLQCTNGAWQGSIFYHNSNNDKWNEATTSCDSNGKDCDIVTLFKNSNWLDIGLDCIYGIGNRNLLSKGNGAFTAVYSKTYFNLVNSAIMKKDDEVLYRGYYRFYFK